MRRAVGLTVVAAIVLGVFAHSGPARRTTFPGPDGRLAIALGGELFTINPDGSARQRVFARTRDLTGYSPAFSPDGSRIAFENRTRPNGGITIVNADGTGRTRVTTQEADDDPAWSPDGRRIAFSRSQNNRLRLHVVNVDGTGLAVLTPDLARDVEDPDWSPDGTRIAFSDNSDVYVVNANGAGLTLLTGGSETGRAQYPSWSPDGSRIAYAGPQSVKVLSPTAPVSGSTLISGLREPWEIAWSPDGTRLAFAHDAAGPLQEELYVANADGSGVTRTGVDTDITVDWGRQAAVPPPVVGVSVNVAPVSGVVRVRLRGTNRFVNLARLRNVPVGSELDVGRGRVTSAAGNRRLWGNGKGRFRTLGRYAGATIRGTIWLTEDRCDGTLIRVQQGRVDVRDNVRNRTITLRAGQSYLARARR